MHRRPLRHQAVAGTQHHPRGNRVPHREHLLAPVLSEEERSRSQPRAQGSHPSEIPDVVQGWAGGAQVVRKRVLGDDKEEEVSGPGPLGRRVVVMLVRR